jgi:hypothetical protein
VRKEILKQTDEDIERINQEIADEMPAEEEMPDDEQFDDNGEQSQEDTYDTPEEEQY